LLNKNYTILHTIIELVHESPRATYKYVLQIKLRPNCFRKQFAWMCGLDLSESKLVIDKHVK